MQVAGILRNAQLPDGRVANICFDQGLIASVNAADSSCGGDQHSPDSVDAAGRLVLPAFVDCHLHLDSTLLPSDTPKTVADLARAGCTYVRRKSTQSEEEIIERATRMAQLCVRQGTLTLGAHADVDRWAGLKGLQALLTVRESLSGLCDMRAIAFMAEGLPDRRSREWLEECCRLGTDCIGARPEADPDPPGCLDALFDIAEDAGLPLHLHIEEGEDPDYPMLEVLASKTIERGFQGRVTAAHCCALGSRPQGEAERVVDVVSQANLTVVTLPSSNLFWNGRADPCSPRRGLTRVNDLINAGVTVTYGSDDTQNAYSPLNMGDMLLNGWLLAHAAHIGASFSASDVLHMATSTGHVALGGTQRSLEVGQPADIVVLDATGVEQALVEQSERLTVIHRGAVVVENRRETKWHELSGANGGRR